MTGPNPTDRGKNGSKIHLITDRNGLPLSLGISGANMHDSLGLQPLVRSIPPIRSRRGPRRRRPAKLHADKGYDYVHLRRWLRKRGIRHRIARKGIESSTRLGRHRWVVERTVSWLAGCRRLHRRYERKAEHFLAFVGIAAVHGCRRCGPELPSRRMPIAVHGGHHVPVRGIKSVQRRSFAVMGSPAYFEKWVKIFHPAPSGAVRLVCLPHAGGSASFFFPMAKAFGPSVEVMAVQYPGRQARRHEPAIDNVPEYADEIFEVLRHLDDRPLALFGHSMGAVLAYEVAIRMLQAGLPAPMRLFASGRRAPSRHRDEHVHKSSDEEIVAELQGLGGPHQRMLNDPELLAMILPAVRSDYRAIERYRHDPQARLDCPVTVLVGDSDPRVSLDEARAWAEHTTAPTELEVFRGGHFFLVDHSTDVIDLVARRLSAQRAEPTR